jgi:lantibiotic modifying enzyme
VPAALPRARRCARHLLESRSVDPTSGFRAWRTLRSVPSSGFAHGASGFAHALLKVHERTGEEELLDAALEAFAFERTLFREDLGNWEDSRAEPEPPGMWSWCHGAPGIALARLSALGSLEGTEGREEAESEIALDLRQALRLTVAGRVPKVDTICCGTFGRIDILLEAGLRLENPSLGRQALRLAGERLRRAEAEGYLLTPVDEIADPLRPGFWQGLGGTAYTLVRLTDPERYPCVLAMA